MIPLEKHPLTVTVNGVMVEEFVESRLTLVDFLRENLDLTGTHIGCEQGVCGACTILLDGEAVRSCLLLAVQANGHDISTIEGLAPNGELTPLMEAMRANHGLQCGFCTPGVVVSLTAFLQQHANPTEVEACPDEERIRRALSANFCRCTGYQGMVKAALEIARKIAT